MTVPEQDATTRSAAVMNGDVAGYSKLTADNEIETHQTLQTLRRIIESAVETEGGQVTQFVGDEFLAILPRAAGGIRAALAMQRTIEEQNGKLPVVRQMRFRLGLNFGPVSEAEGGWFGDVINVAARLQAMARPGGICASGALVEEAGEIPGKVRSMGRRRLKNIPEPVMVYEIVDETVDAPVDKPWRRRIPTSARPSIAVSPFVNFGAAEDDHFAHGLMMALTIELMTIPGLDVVSENSTLGYRDQVHSAQQMGHELGVRHVLEGGVQRSGSSVRVMTQVIDVERGGTTWADRFEAELSDVFAAQDEIVSKIVEALDVEVIGGDLARSYREELDSESVEMVYRGLSDVAEGTPESLRRAYERFEQLVDRIPDSGMAYALTGWTHFWAALQGLVSDSADHYARAKLRALEAIERNDTSGMGYLILAHVLLLEEDWDGALEAVSHVTEQRPSCDLSFGVAASVMRYLGRWEEAVDLASRAIRLSPLMSDWYRSVLANAYFVGEDYEIAVETAEDVVAGDEENTDALLTLAAAEAALGRGRHAQAALRHARRAAPGLSAEKLSADLPYRDRSTKERFVESLRRAGLD